MEVGSVVEVGPPVTSAPTLPFTGGIHQELFSGSSSPAPLPSPGAAPSPASGPLDNIPENNMCNNPDDKLDENGPVPSDATQPTRVPPKKKKKYKSTENSYTDNSMNVVLRHVSHAEPLISLTPGERALFGVKSSVKWQEIFNDKKCGSHIRLTGVNTKSAPRSATTGR